ncbi:hypothetical protein [Nonomuraea sp. NPDC049684]|uniref:hypothetical protein n=1 Tax=Nonomuraea sp. NPDC049684 TaxID=3364356 RepID=UPI0037BBF7D5
MAFAKCMRENGVPSFPAPGADGSFAKNDKANTPEFTKAEEACKHYLSQSISSMTPSKKCRSAWRGSMGMERPPLGMAELIEHWTVLGDEVGLVSAKQEGTRWPSRCC